MDVQIASKSF